VTRNTYLALNRECSVNRVRSLDCGHDSRRYVITYGRERPAMRIDKRVVAIAVDLLPATVRLLVERSGGEDSSGSRRA
jgi:hypothetical protein